MAISRMGCAMALVAYVTSFSATAPAQVLDLVGDGYRNADNALNAPYTGTAEYARHVHDGVGSGEVANFVEPNGFITGGLLLAPGSQVLLWSPAWDRSLLRLYRGMDASGGEIDLTGATSEPTAISVSVESDKLLRLSVKAIGTKSLAPQSVSINVKSIITACDGTNQTMATSTRTFRVSPFGGSFDGEVPEAAAYMHGLRLLEVRAGAAHLVVPAGRTAEMVGEEFELKTIALGSSCVSTMQLVNVALADSAESVFVANWPQFRIQSTIGGPNKGAYGTPWPSYLIGLSSSGFTYLPDGTEVGPSSSSGAGLRRYNHEYPRQIVNDGAYVSRTYQDFAGTLRTTIITDHATPAAHAIVLQRDIAGVVTQVSTSDGRTWEIQSDPVSGRITGVVPSSGVGARYYSYSSLADAFAERVSQVRQSPAVNANVMYEFAYDSAGDLVQEKRFVGRRSGPRSPILRGCSKRAGPR